MNTQTTPLTTICEWEVTYPSVNNETCNATLNYLSNILWVTQLTMTYSEQRLAENVHVGPVSLKAGATVNLQIRGGLLFVIFNGVITESGQRNILTDIQIGTFWLKYFEKPIFLPGN
ncbi:MAG: hypothetical protein OES20_15510 [Gammaproteobacteria bacterium]|nr:hypothetical protein [Gammaproteobacteria bacterium]